MSTINLNPAMLPGETTRQCIAWYASNIWLLESAWLRMAIEQLRTGHYPPAMALDGRERSAAQYEVIDGGMAKINMIGPLLKGESKFGGTTNTVNARRQLRNAARDSAVQGIMLHIDSPGGTVAGTGELAADVAAVAKQKPVHAFIDDMGASAAYWIGSQASRLSAGQTAEVGSIGTVAVVEDTSEAMAAEGIKVHVVSTGDMKGAFEPGTEVTDEQLAYLQERVNEVNSYFLKGVAKGRGIPLDRVRQSADGRVFSARNAVDRGLIDEVQSLDDAFGELQKAIKESNRAPRRAAAMADVMELEIA